MSQFTQDFEAFIREQGFNVFGFAEICDGKSEYVAIKPGNPCQDSYSVAKAFVVTAVGLLYDRKMLDLNERFVDIFPEELPEKMDPRWGKATIHQADGKWQMIFGVATHPEYQRRGLAAKVLQRAIADCKAEGRKGLILTCKEEKLHYYAKFGFVSEGVSVSEHGGALWYQMRLEF